VKRSVVACAMLVSTPAAVHAADFRPAIPPDSASPAPGRRIDLRLVDRTISDALRTRPMGMIVETRITPNARLQLGLFKSVPGGGPRAPRSRKFGVAFKMKF
jgi:hypothetical protein